MTKIKSIIFLGGAIALIEGCSSPSLTPRVRDIKASREAPYDNCIEISKVSGTTSSPKGTAEDALNDMKKEAANKGANYLQIKEYSSYGTAVTGIAFKCP